MEDMEFENQIIIIETERKSNILTLLIKLPDGCTPGRREAVDAFAEAFVEIREKFPEKRFQFIPYNIEIQKSMKDTRPDFGTAITYLAIEQ